MEQHGKAWFFYSWLQGAAGVGLLALLTLTTPLRTHLEAVGAASPRWGEVASVPEAMLTGILFLALASATILLSFRVHHYFITLDAAVGVCCLFLFGPLPAAWTMVAAVGVQSLCAGSRPNVSRAFRAANLASNAGNRVFRILLAGWVFVLCGGSWPLREVTFASGLGEGAPPGWLAPMAAMATLVIVNNGLFLPSEWAAGRSLKKFLAQVLSTDVLVHAAALAMAVVLAVVYSGSGLLPFLVFSALALFVSRTLKQMTESRRALTRRLDELQTLNVVGEAICSTPSVEDLVGLVHEECRKILDFTFFDVVLAEEEGSGYRTVYSAEEEGRETPHRRAPAERLAELASARGEAVVVGTRRELQFLLGGSGGADLNVETSSAVCVPMLESDRMLGALCIQHHLAGRYAGEDLRALATISYQASVALQNLRLYESATRDPLTGLFLRPVLLKRLEEEMLRARTRGNPVQVMVLDLDHLKQINDTYGHAAGDIALRQVAEAVRGSVRGNDVAARFGGDEFVVLLPGVAAEDCLRIATRLQERLRALTFSAGGDAGETAITVSIGLAGFDPEDRFDPAALLAAADRALYRAKEKGRNRTVHARDLREEGPESGTLHWFAPPA